MHADTNSSTRKMKMSKLPQCPRGLPSNTEHRDQELCTAVVLAKMVYCTDDVLSRSAVGACLSSPPPPHCCAEWKNNGSKVGRLAVDGALETAEVRRVGVVPSAVDLTIHADRIAQ